MQSQVKHDPSSVQATSFTPRFSSYSGAPRQSFRFPLPPYIQLGPFYCLVLLGKSLSESAWGFCKCKEGEGCL